MAFHFIRQHDEMDCGSVCLQMILRHYGRFCEIHEIRARCFTNESGTSLYSISQAAESYGFESTAFRCDLVSLLTKVSFPIIAHWNEDHFIVIYKTDKRFVWVADPALNIIKYTHSEFLLGFESEGTDQGTILTLNPSFSINNHDQDIETEPNAWKYLIEHLFRYKIFIYQVLIAAFASSTIVILLPLMTKALIDEGIVNQDYLFIKAIIVGQLLLFAGKVSFDALRSWIILHWSYRINLSIISSFLMDLLGLSAQDLQKKSSADILQRIDDYQHVEQFIAHTSINVVLSGITFTIFSILLLNFNISIFLIFCIGTLISILWVWAFQKKRKQIYYKLVGLMTQNKSNIIEIIESLQEIKIFRLEQRMRWKWEDIQVKEYQATLKNLKIEQTQEVGFHAINEIKNITIIFVGAISVMRGELSIGTILAIAFITGELNNSLSFLPSVFHIGQDAKISLERLIGISQSSKKKKGSASEFASDSITMKDVSFSYDGYTSVIKNLTLQIPHGKTIAIVGSSGSGKTTLLKLLMKFQEPTNGKIIIGETDLEHISDEKWRSKIGVVSQDGFIFSDTVSNNISLSSPLSSMKRVVKCAKIANIHGEINDLPNGYLTKIGQNGVTMSKGQYQRILIARAIYDDPEYLFFDEATSALDSSNEKIIQGKLQIVFKKKTVFIIAHRLSTVVNADNIIVLEKGSIIEQGNHMDLVSQKGHYFNLVKDQLQLGE